MHETNLCLKCDDVGWVHQDSAFAQVCMSIYWDAADINADCVSGETT